MAKDKDYIPTRRFPQFAQEKGWDYVNANELFEPIVNKNHNSDLPVLAITQDQGAVPRDKIDYNVIVSEKSIAGYKVVEIGDFIISLRSFQGGIEYSYYKGLCSPAYIVLRKKNNTICNDFYRHYFKSWQFIQDLNRNLEGIRDGKMVSYQQFSEILIPYPPFAEQQKIADCLSSIDELIKISNGKLEMLKSQKAGLMQQLFTPINGGGNFCIIPKLRFPNFYNSKGWEVKTLGELFSIMKNGTNYDTNNLSGYPMSRIETISAGSINYNKVGYSLIEPKEYKMQKGDILFSHINSIANIGKVAFYDGSKVLYHGMNLLLLRCKKDYNSLFVYYLLNTSFMKCKYQSIAKRAVNQASISTSELGKLTVSVPKSINEQYQIAQCLSFIDTAARLSVTRKAIIEHHKRGLIQQLFPKS